MSSAFTAGFALGFPDSDAGIRLGMAATKRLSHSKFTPHPEDHSPDYPVKVVMDKLTPMKNVSTMNLPSNSISSGDSLSIFDHLTGDTGEVARQIVTQGPEKAIARCPVREFGRLLSVDRTEQESLGSIVDTLHERLESKNVDPTCIGVIGPMGSGKNFVAANLAAQVGETWPIRKLTYSARGMKLEQFTNACNTIRDNTAEKLLTVVIFENFEDILESDSPLLDDFSALMRYGSFKDSGHERTVGKCVLMFLANQDPPIQAASTPTPTAGDFNFKRSLTMSSDLRSKADESALLDNLHGAVNLLGPNQAGPGDKTFVIRRALMLRQLLIEKHPHLNVNGTIKIDDTVLHALLFVPAYKHGLRSLEKIISTSRLSGRAKFDISALPPEEQIQLHVDGRLFMSFLRSPKLPPVLREKLAEGLFERYKRQKVLMADTPEKKEALQADRAMVDWDELSGELKESTRSQADDIPRKLRACNYFMLNEVRSDPFILVPAFTHEDLEMLQEMEHERFNAERLQRQWYVVPIRAKRISHYVC